MVKKAAKVLLCLLLAIGLTSAIYAQRQTGSIAGKIVDEAGQPLPGASVTLSGPAMMGTLTYSTTEEGDFRFPAVNPGREYVLTAGLSGFEKIIRGGLIVSVGKTISVTIELKPAAIAKEVTVTAPSPTIDVTSTKHSVTYSTDLINNIPMSRDYYDIIRTAPGTVDDGFQDRRTFSAYGSAVRGQNQVALEGVSITDSAIGTNKIGFSFDIFEEVELEMGAHQAEVGVTPGGYINIVTKSGGNEFHGNLLAYYFNKDMAQSLIPTEEAKATGLSAPMGLKAYNDYSASLGGPIIKDKLWFFANGRLLSYKNDTETKVDGVFESTHDEIAAFGKLTFQARRNIRLTGMLSFRNYDEPFGLVGGGAAQSDVNYYSSKYSAFFIDNARNWVALGMINWVLDQNTFIDIRVSYNNKNEPFHYNPEVGDLTLRPAGRLTDRYTGLTTGVSNWNYDFHTTRTQASVSFNRFLDHFLGGNHELKSGLEYDLAPCYMPAWKSNPINFMYTYNGAIWGYQDVKPYRGYFEAGTVGETPEDWTMHLRNRRFGIYIQDSFTIKDRLTLNLGLRYDDSRGDAMGATFKNVGAKNPVLTMLAPNMFKDYTIPDIKNLAVWKDFSPRVGAIFDVFGDKTTSFRASWAQYHDYMIQSYTIPLTPTHPKVLTAYWDDLNKNGIMDTSDAYTLTSPLIDPLNYPLSDYVDPNFTSPLTNEIIFGLDRELFKDFSLGVSYIYKKYTRLVENVQKLRGYTPDSGWYVPVTLTEPGWDGKYGTADDKEIIVYGVKKGAPPSKTWETNPPEAKRKYQALEFIFQKRMSKGWQLLCSVSLSRLEGNRLGTYSTGGYFTEPNGQVNRYGRQDFDRPVIIKLEGTFTLPFDFMVSGYYIYSSGAPWGRTLQVQIPNDPSIFEYPGTFTTTVMAEAPGTRRYRGTSNFDLRIERYFGFGNTRLGIFLDVLNVFGENWYNVTQDPGGRVYANRTFQKWTTYGRFAGVYGLRTFKVCARFTF